jgi:hypothetical protein
MSEQVVNTNAVEPILFTEEAKDITAPVFADVQDEVKEQ